MLIGCGQVFAGQLVLRLFLEVPLTISNKFIHLFQIVAQRCVNRRGARENHTRGHGFLIVQGLSRLREHWRRLWRGRSWDKRRWLGGPRGLVRRYCRRGPITAYLEDGLDPADRERFEEHLVFCDGCKNYLAQVRTTVRLTGRASQALPTELEAELLEVFRNWRAS